MTDTSHSHPTYAEVASGKADPDHTADAEGQKHSEVHPFIEDPSGGKDAPIDTNSIVYLIILLHGVGTLMPWNMFITIAPQYYSNYKMMDLDVNGTGTYSLPTQFSANFLNYLGICSQVPNLLLNFINIFITVKGDLTGRIAYSLCVVGLMIAFTMGFIYVDTWSWMTGFFALTMLSVIILNAGNGIYQNSIFGLAADFPFKYTNAVIIGNNLCGTFVTVVNIITFSLTSDVANAAFAYFTISLVTLGMCFGSFFILKKKEFFIYNSEKAARQRAIDQATAGPITKDDYILTLKEGWKAFLNVFLVFFVTLCCFPGLMADVSDESAGETYDFFLPKKHFVTITTFLLFNLLAFIGSLFAGKYQYPDREHLWIPVYLRIVFIPFFAFCNYRVNTRTFPVLFSNTWIFIIGGTIMSLSSGYLSGLGMMYAPSAVNESRQRIAGMMAGFFLIFGIVSGLAFTIFVSWIIANLGPTPVFAALGN